MKHLELSACRTALGLGFEIADFGFERQPPRQPERLPPLLTGRGAFACKIPSKITFLNIFFLLTSLLTAFIQPAGAQVPVLFPPTQMRPVTDEYHGVKVVDNYRWLEDAKDPEVRKWVEDQNVVSRSILEKGKLRADISERLKTLYQSRSVIYYSFYQRGMFFAMKLQPGKNQPLLVMMKTPADTASARAVLDPNELDPKGTTAIDFYAPSFDGRFVALSLSENGSEDGTLHIYETSTGKKLDDVIPRVQYPTGGGSVEWNKDGSGVYYTRYPQNNERAGEDINFYQQVYFHKLGTPISQDSDVIGKEFPRIAEITLKASEDGDHLLATVANGDGGEFAHYIRKPSGEWTQVTRFEDQVRSVYFGTNRVIYLLTARDAPRGRIMSLSLDDLKLSKAKTVIPEGRATIESFTPASTRLYTGEMTGGPSEIAIFDLEGTRLGSIPTKPVSSVQTGIRLAGDEILFGSQSYVEPYGWYRFSPQGGVSRTALTGTPSGDFSDIEVERAFATSKDGTKVPLNIVKRKGTKLNGKNPVILFGYGGYSVNISPAFQRRNRIWLNAGGIYVEANLRGGAEYGEEWHKAGKLTRKQNVFDDFAACARYLIRKKYTSPGKLAIEGGSNGGLLMGAALTQHPGLFRAVVAYAGWYDMLRVETAPNGMFNVPELGTVSDPEQFKALYAYSPYHRVKDGTRYPAVLFITGDNDGRVDPMHSRKMTARLQAATSSGLPVILRTSSDTGHGAGSAFDARIAQETDFFAFLFEQLKVKGR